MAEPEVDTELHYFFFGAPRRGSEPADHKDPNRVSLPPQAYGFIFVTNVFTNVEYDGRELHLCTHTFSPAYFVGEEYSLERLQEELPVEELESMLGLLEHQAVQRLVRTPSGIFVHPETEICSNFDQDDDEDEDITAVIIPPSGLWLPLEGTDFSPPEFVPDELTARYGSEEH